MSEIIDAVANISVGSDTIHEPPKITLWVIAAIIIAYIMGIFG